MSSRQENFLEGSTEFSNEHMLEHDLATGSSRTKTDAGIVSASCPAEPKRKYFPSKDNGRDCNRWEKCRLCHSWTQTPAENANQVYKHDLAPSNSPLVSRVQHHQFEESGQSNDGQETGSSSFSCTDFFKKSTIKFTKSRFIFVLQVLFSMIPVSAIVMGIMFNDKCPGFPLLSAFVVIIGVTGVISITSWMVIGYNYRHGKPSAGEHVISLAAFCLLFAVTTAVEMYLVGKTSPSFEPSAPNYCDKTFYYYTLYKEIVTAGIVIVAAMLYLPSVCLCYRHCSAPVDYDSI